jgi:hypothetical protein
MSSTTTTTPVVENVVVENVVVENVVEENVVVTVKEKKPRKPRAPKVTTEASSEVVVPTDIPTVTNGEDDSKKTKKPRAPKTKKEAVVEVVTELQSEQIYDSEPIDSKKSRTPSLPAKYNKFLQFGYYFIQSLKDSEGNINVNTLEQMYQHIHLFDTVDNQQQFVQGFFDQSKDINKTIRKIVSNQKKANIKAAKMQAKLDSKKNKKTNNNITPNDDSFVSDIVSLATNSDKPKPKRKYNKKNNNSSHNDNDNHNHNDNDTLDVEVVSIDGVNYLVDNTKRVFDFNSHNLLGYFDNLNSFILY